MPIINKDLKPMGGNAPHSRKLDSQPATEKSAEITAAVSAQSSAQLTDAIPSTLKIESSNRRQNRAFRLLWVGLAAVMMMIWLESQWLPEWATAQFSPVESPLLSPTPLREIRTVNEVLHPRSGDAIAGETEIIGTALIADFMRYDIHIARSGEGRWSWVTSSTEVVHEDVLHVLNTRGYADGRYDLSVRAVNMQAQFSEFIVENLEIRNARPPTPTPNRNITPVPRSPLPTPTPTPDMRARMPGGTGIYAPDLGAVLRGSVDVIGAVGGQFRNPLSRWDLSIAPMNSEGWIVVRSGSEVGFGLTLAQLDTTQYEDGLYDMRLQVAYQDGTSTDYFVRQLSIANQGQPQFAFVPRPAILAPGAGEQVTGELVVVATVPPAGLMHWELAWSPQGLGLWTLLTTGDRPVSEAQLARINVGTMPSGVYDLRLRVVSQNAEPQETFVRGLVVQGLPPPSDD